MIAAPLIRSQEPAPSSADALREQAIEILKAAQYRQVVDESVMDERVKQAFSWLDRLDAWLARTAVDAPGLYWLLLVGLLLLLFLLIAHIIWTIHRYRKVRVDPFGDPNLPVAEWTHEALAAALAAAEEEGRFADALALRFRRSLLQLQRSLPGRLRPGWTNRELVAIWPVGLGHRPQLLELVQLIDRTWYGQVECPEADYRRAVGQLEQIESELQQAAGRGR